MAGLTAEDLPEDFSVEEKEALVEYVGNGVPGMTKVQESDIFQWFTMYMAGKTYAEIAVAAKVNKEKVLFISHKNKWLDKKMEHFNNIVTSLQNKASAAKIDSANVITTMISSFNKYYNDIFTKFLLTGDVSLVEGLDTKMLGQYHKLIENLEKVMGNSTKGEGEGQKHPLININMGNNAKMTENEDGSVDLDALPPSADALGDVLKLLAAAKKSKETED